MTQKLELVMPKSHLIINPEAESGRSAIIEYNKKSFMMLVEYGSPPIAPNFSKNIVKDTSVSFTVITDDTDLNSDVLYVTISDVDDLDGSVIVNSDDTITFTPDSGFLGTTSFEYTIDDVLDGQDTGIITITVDSAAILASINQISVYSDKATYAIGDTIDANWIIPTDSSGTDTTFRVITPIGTNAVNDVLSNSTEHLTPTDNFVDGTYTIRVEHGQYYGETSVLFTSSTETNESTITSDTTTEISDTELVSGSCADDSKISIQLGDTSYTKGEKVSVSTDLCNVISNEYVIVQIFDPFNAQLAIDQFLPTNTNFNKKYSTDGGLWKLDGKHIIKSTYLGNSVESTFSFIVPLEKIPAVDLTESIASFVDADKDPQYYVDRYNNEESYKEWFDTNYSQYDSIYQAVGLDESTSILNSKNVDVSGSSTTDVESKSTPEYDDPTCGTGTELVNGLCEIIKINKKSAQEESFFENIFVFFKSLIN